MAVLFFIVFLNIFQNKNALALDRRLEKPGMVFVRTSLMGAGGGAVLGAAAWVFFDVGVRGMAKAASLGLYSGALFGLFVLMAPPELIYGEDPKRQEDRPPPSPRRFEERYEEEDYSGVIHHRRREFSQLMTSSKNANVAVWLPFLSLRF